MKSLNTGKTTSTKEVRAAIKQSSKLQVACPNFDYCQFVQVKSLGEVETRGNAGKLNDVTGKHKVQNAKNSGKKTSLKQKLILLASGAVIGILNGFFGGGGGMVCVPILEKVLKLDNKRSHATAIAVILPLSLISAFIYVFNGYLETFPLLIVGAGVVVGGVVGSFALKFLPPKAVRAIFAVVMFAGGVKLLIG